MKQSWTDPIVEEIRKNWEEYAAGFNYDLDAIFCDLQRMDEEDEEPVVSFSHEDAPPNSPRRTEFRTDLNELRKAPWVDPIVEEMRRYGQEYAAQFSSFEEMFKDLVRRQNESGRPVVSFASERRRNSK